MKENFIKTYNHYKQEFEASNYFQNLVCKKNKKLIWPKTYGVYTIWKTNSDSSRNLLYIGMTGKFKRNDQGIVELNGGSFTERSRRWTPYRFCQSKNDGNFKYTFRFGPKYKNVDIQGKHKYDEDAYSYAVPYNKLVIHCFTIPSDHPKFTGTYIESALLTSYLKDTGTLPPANNSL